MAKSGPERATEVRFYDLLRARVGQKQAPRLGNTICYGQEMVTKFVQPKVGQKEPPRLVGTICYIQGVGRKEPPRLGSTISCGQDLGRKATNTRQYKQKPSRLGSTIYYTKHGRKKPQRLGLYDLLQPRVGQKKISRVAAVRFVTAKSWAETATETRQCVLLRAKVGQKKPPRLGSTICYGQE